MSGRHTSQLIVSLRFSITYYRAYFIDIKTLFALTILTDVLCNFSIIPYIVMKPFNNGNTNPDVSKQLL